MKAKIPVIGAVVLLLMSGEAQAALTSIELPSLATEVGQYPDVSVADFDFGTPFLSIDEVQIHAVGTASAGTAYGDGTFNPVDQLFSEPPELRFSMDAGSGSCYARTGAIEGPFDIKVPFLLKYGATWDFLLDGQDRIDVSWLYSNLLIGAIEQSAATEISEAYLIVEGTIPEPATIFLFGVGAILTRARHHKPKRHTTLRNEKA
jgi:hypothetical protein